MLFGGLWHVSLFCRFDKLGREWPAKHIYWQFCQLCKFEFLIVRVFLDNHPYMRLELCISVHLCLIMNIELQWLDIPSLSRLTLIGDDELPIQR